MGKKENINQDEWKKGMREKEERRKKAQLFTRKKRKTSLEKKEREIDWNSITTETCY